MPDDMMPKFYKFPLNIPKLQEAFKIASLPIANVRINSDLTLSYDWYCTPTEAQFQQAAEIVLMHDPLATIESKQLEEYNAAGITMVAMVDALWEKIANGNSALLDALKAKQIIIKDKVK